jgi:hypothetical protein
VENTTNNESYFAIGDDPGNPDSIISGNMPSDEHLIAMGKVIVAFTELEQMVSICFSLLLGCEPELASIIANSLPTRERCDTLFHIFAYRFGSAEMIRSGTNTKKDIKLRQLSNIFDKIDKAATIRNQIAHSTWSASKEDGQKVHRLKWIRTRTQPGFPQTDYSLLTPEDILKNVVFINQVSKDLHIFFWDNFGGWIQERAKNKEGGLQLL